MIIAQNKQIELLLKLDETFWWVDKGPSGGGCLSKSVRSSRILD